MRTPRLATTLAAATGLILVVALAVGGLLARQRTRSEVVDLFESTTLQEDAALLDQYRADNGSWDGVEPLLRGIAAPWDERLILTDPAGDVVADTHPDVARPDVDELSGDWEFEHADQTTVLYTLGGAEGVGPTLGDLDRFYAGAAAVAVVLAVGLTVVVARRTVRPLRSLSEAAATMAAGDLTTRVPTHGPREIAAVAQAFNAMASSLSQAEQRQRAMTADVAHELRSPIANLQAWTEGLLDGVMPNTRTTHKVIHQQALRLRRLADDLESLALADANALRLHHEPIELSRPVLEAVAGVQAAATARDVTLTVDHGEDPTVVADPTRLAQILRNILDNAIRHAASSVTVEVATDDAWIRIAVSDDGPGIDPAHLDRVFDRFHRVDAARTTEQGGAGLGLAIAKQLTVLHGGTVAAGTRGGGGAVLTVSLPRDADMGTQASTDQPLSPQQRRHSRRGRPRGGAADADAPDSAR